MKSFGQKGVTSGEHFVVAVAAAVVVAAAVDVAAEPAVYEAAVHGLAEWPLFVPRSWKLMSCHVAMMEERWVQGPSAKAAACFPGPWIHRCST